MVADALSRKPFGLKGTNFLEDWKKESAQLNACLGNNDSLEVKPMLEDLIHKAQRLDSETARLVERARKEQLPDLRTYDQGVLWFKHCLCDQKGRPEKPYSRKLTTRPTPSTQELPRCTWTSKPDTGGKG